MSNNWQTTLYKIAQATRENKLVWKRATSHIDEYLNATVTWSYITEDTEDPLRLYKIEFIKEEDGTSVHSSNLILEFIDNTGRSLWKFPEHQAIEDISSAVQYQANGIDAKLARLLKIK